MFEPGKLVSAFCLITLAGCGSMRFSDVHADFEVTPGSIDLGTVWIGTGKHVSVSVTNDSRAKLLLHVTSSGPIEVSDTLQLEGGETAELPLFVNPSEEGPLSVSVVITADDITRAVSISGTAQLPPTCMPSNDCHQSVFDPDQGVCVESLLAEDTSCGNETNSCVVGGVCRSGECVGLARSCDDGNLCTTDACVLGQGCVHFDDSAKCADTADPCQAGFCDPKTGCNSAEAPDGTKCDASDCVTAHVCISGACVERPVPDGAACGEDSPCQGAGTCQSGSCVQPAATTMQPLWTYRPVVHMEFFGLVDGLDQSYLMDCNRSCSLVSLTKTGGIRYQVPMSSISIQGTGMLLSGGNVIAAFQNGELESRRAQDGSQVFAISLLPLLEPDFFPLSTMPASVDTLQLADIASDGAGHLYVRAIGWTQMGDGMLNRGHFLVAIDEFTGTVLWHHRAFELGASLIVDDVGRVLITEHPTNTESAITWLVAFSSSGTELFRVPVQDGDPIAAASGRVVSNFGAVRRSDTGAPLSSVPAWGWLDGVLLHGTSAWSIVSGDIAPSTSVIRSDVTTGDIRWSSQAAPLGYWSSSVALTDRDSLLLVGQDSTGMLLNELDAFGKMGFSCRLNGGDTVSNVALQREQLVAQMWTECNTCLRDPGEELVAFSLPKRRPATSGWTSAKGSAQRMNRPK